MFAGYQLLPTTDPDGLAGQHSRGLVLTQRIRAFFSDVGRLAQAHADALDSGWLTELERLGPAVFCCFMVLRLGMLSLGIFWGFLLLSPFWLVSWISNDNFLPYAIQTGLIITLIIILEALPFVGLMRDARSKIYHVLYAAYLLLAWREVCIFLVPVNNLGKFALQNWVREGCYMIAAASTLGCGAIGCTIWEGTQRKAWLVTTVVALGFLSLTYQIYKPDSDILIASA
ncbi:hypothetical protein M422DRAFT_261254 [Sphaerobolus stellatus SS14]|uniref:Uncharacterized protein n=1 Tax=Sphaerobolus stellatus (strain SS14) TaxID=990650 RepID=A0A0C9V3I2_SPHS4|nr:hypothetical protein M422DRAFT_261254 [Sphaerobolus stellatus SS14]